TGDVAGVAQAHLASGAETKELIGRILHKVVAFDIYRLGERHHSIAARFVGRVVRALKPLLFALGKILDDYLDRIENGHAPRRFLLEVLAQAVLEKRILVDPLSFGDARSLAEF